MANQTYTGWRDAILAEVVLDDCQPQRLTACHYGGCLADLLRQLLDDGFISREMWRASVLDVGMRMLPAGYLHVLILPGGIAWIGHGEPSIGSF